MDKYIYSLFKKKEQLTTGLLFTNIHGFYIRQDEMYEIQLLRTCLIDNSKLSVSGKRTSVETSPDRAVKRCFYLSTVNFRIPEYYPMLYRFA